MVSLFNITGTDWEDVSAFQIRADGYECSEHGGIPTDFIRRTLQAPTVTRPARQGTYVVDQEFILSTTLPTTVSNVADEPVFDAGAISSIEHIHNVLPSQVEGTLQTCAADLGKFAPGVGTELPWS